MANDRLYITCVKCGEGKQIFKHYCGPKSSYADADFLDEFMCKHLYDCQKQYTFELKDPGFVILTEQQYLDSQRKD